MNPKVCQVPVMERRMTLKGKTEPQGKTCQYNMRDVSPSLVSSWEAPVTPWERENNLHCCPSCTQVPSAAVTPKTCKRASDTRLVLCGSCSVLEHCQCIPLSSLSPGTWWGCSGPTCKPRKLASHPDPSMNPMGQVLGPALVL